MDTLEAGEMYLVVYYEENYSNTSTLLYMAYLEHHRLVVEVGLS